jgi:hypothetical protein
MGKILPITLTTPISFKATVTWILVRLIQKAPTIVNHVLPSIVYIHTQLERMNALITLTYLLTLQLQCAPMHIPILIIKGIVILGTPTIMERTII